jgi:hypothetical protein
MVALAQQVRTQDIRWMDAVVRAKPSHRVPVVLPQDAVTAVWRHLSGPTKMSGQHLAQCWVVT